LTTLLKEAIAAELPVHDRESNYRNINPRSEQTTMAALLAVSIGLGAEKLGRRISDKRLERKEKKAIAQHDAIYGSSSSVPPRPTTTSERQGNTEQKHQEAQQTLQEARQERQLVPEYESRRNSTCAEGSNEEEAPPSYNDVVRQDARRT